ncbi:uncharacterized protein LOC112568054 [Pomacea canaliculata]|uniref:uncharacterized protein LOC112568054 n=1 Tax=Pomacea canaliculata TaxID=400727 RepID=UPI000D7309D9|nr:uncharacterized protein LOC112568054 [Pomacea canaliculata]
MSNINEIQPLRRVWLIELVFLIFLLLLTSSTNGQDYSCNVELTEGCMTKVTCTIPEEYAREWRPFTISYQSKDGKTENAAVLHNVGYYVCESAGDHTCDQNPTAVTINSTGHCVSGREYKLTADGENGISCSMITNAESNESTDTGCSDGTSDDALGTSSTSDEGDVTNKHVQKKAANQKCPPKLNIDKEEISRGQESSDNIAIGVGCGVAALAVIMIIGVFCFITRRTRKLDRLTCQSSAKHDCKHSFASLFLTCYFSRNAEPPDPEDVEASKRLAPPEKPSGNMPVPSPDEGEG